MAAPRFPNPRAGDRSAKISASSCHSRKVLVAPQKAEQLVEVPTIISYYREVRIGGGGERRGLQSLFPGQNTTAQSAQIVDIPVPRGQGFLPGQGSTAFFYTSASSGVHCTRASGVPIASSYGRVHPLHLLCFACPSQWWSFLHPAPVASCRAAGPVGGPQNFVRGESSTAVRRDGGPGGGLQNFIPGQSSTALGGAGDVDDLIRRSQELIEYYSVPNHFERFRGFLELSSRFEFDFFVAKIIF